SSPGDALLRRAIGAIDGQQSVAAKMRQKVELMSQSMVGTGIYFQQGRGAQRLLRLELALQISDKPSTMVQICDGASLWIQEDLSDRHSLSRIDLARLRR